MKADIVCTCATPLIASTADTVEIDDVVLDNKPPICIRCYVRGREAQPVRLAAAGGAND